MEIVGLTPDFWRGRRVLVTGHTGFKGGWLYLWLQSLGAQVYGFSLPPSERSFFRVVHGADDAATATGDLRDPSQVEAVFRETQPEVVFHLAAQALVRVSYDEPAETFGSNVTGTVNLLEAVRRTPSVQTVLVVTSDKCYENREQNYAFLESDPMGGKDPYSASKACVELLTSAWRESFLQPRVAVATARAGNVIGGGDWAVDRLIPDAIRAWESGECLVIRNPRAVRPWQYHLDALAGYLMLSAELAQGRCVGAWNFGPEEGDMLSVEALLRRFAAQWGGNSCWKESVDRQPHEAQLLRLDAGKARRELGWSSLFGIDDSLEQITNWHRAWRGGEDMRSFSLAQIEHYMERMNGRNNVAPGHP